MIEHALDHFKFVQNQLKDKSYSVLNELQIIFCNDIEKVINTLCSKVMPVMGSNQP